MISYDALLFTVEILIVLSGILGMWIYAERKENKELKMELRHARKEMWKEKWARY